MSADAPESEAREYTPVSALSDWIPQSASVDGPTPHLDLLIKHYPGRTGGLTARLQQLYAAASAASAASASSGGGGAAAGAGVVVWVSEPVTTLTLPALLPPPDDALPSPSPSPAAATASPVADGTDATAQSVSVGATVEIRTAGEAAASSTAAVLPPAAAAKALAEAAAGAHYGPSDAIVLVAGGTGITPMLQVSRSGPHGPTLTLLHIGPCR